MALALMEDANDVHVRLRRHDLESLLWLLSWICEGDSDERLKWSDPNLRMAKLNKCHYHNVRPQTASSIPTMIKRRIKAYGTLCVSHGLCGTS